MRGVYAGQLKRKKGVQRHSNNEVEEGEKRANAKRKGDIA